MALYTTPMPPRPMMSMTSYFPIFAGTLEAMMFRSEPGQSSTRCPASRQDAWQIGERRPTRALWNAGYCATNGSRSQLMFIARAPAEALQLPMRMPSPRPVVRAFGLKLSPIVHVRGAFVTSRSANRMHGKPAGEAYRSRFIAKHALFSRRMFSLEGTGNRCCDPEDVPTQLGEKFCIALHFPSPGTSAPPPKSVTHCKPSQN